MINKPLLDINVCLDLLLKRNPYLQEAAEIFQRSEYEEIQAVISAISFDTLAYIMCTYFSARETADKLKKMTSITSIGMANEAVINNALKAGWKDIEDAIQYQCAVENSCDAIITRNVDDFSKSSLPVLTPFDFLER
jgi:predicted nucleic acid-binding protein